MVERCAGSRCVARRTAGTRNDGWGLKCTNSALKALELRDDPPQASELRVWAIDVLDRTRSGATREPRTLPLTVLAWEGPQARAYLVRMRRAGLQPERDHR